MQCSSLENVFVIKCKIIVHANSIHRNLPLGCAQNKPLVLICTPTCMHVHAFAHTDTQTDTDTHTHNTHAKHVFPYLTLTRWQKHSHVFSFFQSDNKTEGHYDSRNVLIRPMWDNVRIHDEMGLPMYMAWSAGHKSTVVDALVTEAESYSRPWVCTDTVGLGVKLKQVFAFLWSWYSLGVNLKISFCCGLGVNLK